MLRGALWLLLLLLLPLRTPGVQGHRDATSRGQEADEQEADEQAPWPGIQRLKEQLRTAGVLSKRYWALLSCAVWPDHCEDQETLVPPLGWSLPLWGRRSLDMFTAWFCHFQDCCTGGDCRIANNLTGLESDLHVRLHGQHLASKLVLRAVRDYLEMPQVGKALALSFHGWSGTGKNFVARMLADNLYRDGMRSDCVRMFISTFHFPHPKYVDAYKEELLRQMQETQWRCHQTMFIFDEAEKLHPGLLELLGPHLEPRPPQTQGAEPPRAIFLFLRYPDPQNGFVEKKFVQYECFSKAPGRFGNPLLTPWLQSQSSSTGYNLGGSVINEVVLGLLMAGWSREEITMQHLETPLQAEIMESADSSFGSSRLVKENLIDLFIPFLPLEYRHVRLCVRDAFLGQDLPYTEEALDEIAKMVTYVPKEERLFSSQGCKSISQRINLILP